eukprot:736847-Rhodomonas_salina.1
MALKNRTIKKANTLQYAAATSVLAGALLLWASHLIQSGDGGKIEGKKKDKKRQQHTSRTIEDVPHYGDCFYHAVVDAAAHADILNDVFASLNVENEEKIQQTKNTLKQSFDRYPLTTERVQKYFQTPTLEKYQRLKMGLACSYLTHDDVMEENNKMWNRINEMLPQDKESALLHMENIFGKDTEITNMFKILSNATLLNLEWFSLLLQMNTIGASKFASEVEVNNLRTILEKIDIKLIVLSESEFHSIHNMDIDKRSIVLLLQDEHYKWLKIQYD